MSRQQSFGGSDGEVMDKAFTAMAEFMQSVQPGCMLQKFVVITETIDDEDRWISCFTAPGQKRWDTLGLLTYATAIDTAVVVHDEGDGDED